jgi:P-loop Nucleotide Kinase3
MRRPPTLVYVIGEPGVGKTTAMRSATTGLARTIIPARFGGVTREVLVNPNSLGVVGVELGFRRDGGFSGTDSLAMNAVVGACAYLTSGRAEQESHLILGEGARLGNNRFLSAAVHAGWAVRLVHILGAEVAAARRQARGSKQNESWVKGSATRAARLSSQPPAHVQVHYVDTTSDPAGLIAELAGLREGVAAGSDR